MRSSVIIILIFSLLMLPVMYFGGEYIMRLFTKKRTMRWLEMG